MADWPWSETRIERRTRVATLYRDALFEHAPHACYELDQLMDSFGQHWITGNKPPLNPDEPMTAKEIADWTDTRINNIINLIAARGIRPLGRRGGCKIYRLSDFTDKPQKTANA